MVNHWDHKHGPKKYSSLTQSYRKYCLVIRPYFFLHSPTHFLGRYFWFVGFKLHGYFTLKKKSVVSFHKQLILFQYTMYNKKTKIKVHRTDVQGSIILLLPPPPFRGGGKKSKIRNQGREFITYKEKEG